MSVSSQRLTVMVQQSLRLVSVSCATLMGLFSSAIALAQTPTPSDSERTVEDRMYEQLLTVPSNYAGGPGFLSEAAEDWPIITPETVSLYSATLPSLWWSRDQLPTLWRVAPNSTVRVEGYRLVRDWTAFYSNSAETAVIDVQVDPQYWNRLNYFQQYAILRRFGGAGMIYGYHVRIYNSISLVGVHSCDFSSIRDTAESPEGQIDGLADLSQVNCTASIGPFIDYVSPELNDDLFAPP
ncbi:MAG: hypothetical protein ACFBSG_05885 [Leptolyngbyaceae cyanobacterium]